MAFAAVISLKQTINALLDSSSTREILEFAYDQTTSLQRVLERFNDSSGRYNERLYALEGEIRDCAHQLEDALEFNDSELMPEISSFAQVVKKMEVDYIEELSKLAVVPATPAVSSHIDFGVEMVGHSTVIKSLRDLLPRRMRPDAMWFFSLFGEVGSGRTAVAKEIFEDGRKELFDCGAWVTVGSNYETEEVLMRILAYLDLQAHYEMLGREVKDVRSYLNIILKARKCLIVLDDVHDEEFIYDLIKSCPDHSNGSLIMFTTSSEEVSRIADMKYIFQKPNHFFFRETMAFFFSDMVDESMSPKLVEYGKKIFEICPRARFPIAKTLLFLYKTKKTSEQCQWSKLATDKDIPVFMVGDEISERRKIKREIQSFMDDGQYDTIIELAAHMVDISKYIGDIKMLVQPERYFCKMQIVSLYGMAGIGKSTCVRKIFKDESIMCHFDHCVWVNVGPNYPSEEILIDILAQIYPSIDKMLMKGDEELARGLCAELACKRCLIVLDDLWSKEPLFCLKYAFPDIKGTTFVTTRLVKVAKFGRDDICYEIKLLDNEESWCLFCEKVFGQGLCPSELEKAGRKIVEKCEGLPLLILTVADNLLKVEISVEYWNNVASGKQKSVFIDAHHEISKALLPSFERLSQHLKACFLYIGVFCNEYEIPTSKLINLWIVERFVEPNLPQILEDIAAEYLFELVDNSIVMVHRKFSGYEIRTCRLHPVYWHLSNSVAARVKLFYAMNSYDDCSIESMKCQRRLCIRNSILLGIKGVYQAVKSCSKLRALLCTSAPHQYPVPLYFGSRLLRVLEAVAIRFYEFPVEVVELIHLRYLSLTCNGGLPTSISKLWRLQHLIVNRYINSISFENCAPLPMEIWDMKELKHLQVMGGILPNPKCVDGLPNLATLLDVRAESCTKKVIKRIPNLKRLGIQIELSPDERSNPFRYLNRISRLRRLESLKCVVMNPHIGSNGVAPPAPFSMFPSSLKELSLSGFGYPWEYMSIIGRLKNLEVLKLKRYAFRGPRWVRMDDTAFWKVKFLSVEDTDLVQWEGNVISFRMVERVSIKHCYKLQEISNIFDHYALKKLEIVDCNPFIVRWAEQVRDVVKLDDKCEVKIHLSWIDEK